MPATTIIAACIISSSCQVKPEAVVVDRCCTTTARTTVVGECVLMWVGVEVTFAMKTGFQAFVGGAWPAASQPALTSYRTCMWTVEVGIANVRPFSAIYDSGGNNTSLGWRPF